MAQLVSQALGQFGDERRTPSEILAAAEAARKAIKAT